MTDPTNEPLEAAWEIQADEMNNYQGEDFLIGALFVVTFIASRHRQS